MATELIKNTFGNDERALLCKALETMKASMLRAKTKEANDKEMTDIYDARIAKIEALRNKIMTKEMF